MVDSPKTPAPQGAATSLSVRVLIAGLLLLLVLLVVRLIFGDGSVQEVWRLHEVTESQRLKNNTLRLRNQALAAEVKDLQKGLEAVEERARSELGMVRDGEVFYQFIDREQSVSQPVAAKPQPSSSPSQ